MKAKKVFQSRKITRGEAKKLRPLTKYWQKRLLESRNSDNWAILGVGVVMGIIWGLIAGL